MEFRYTQEKLSGMEKETIIRGRKKGPPPAGCETIGGGLFHMGA